MSQLPGTTSVERPNVTYRRTSDRAEFADIRHALECLRAASLRGDYSQLQPSPIRGIDNPTHIALWVRGHAVSDDNTFFLFRETVEEIGAGAEVDVVRYVLVRREGSFPSIVGVFDAPLANEPDSRSAVLIAVLDAAA